MTVRLTVPHVLAIVLTLSAVGYFVAWSADPGLSKFRDDPVEYRVAVNALQAYWSLHRNPVDRFREPGAKVTRVWRDPGHCHDARANGEAADYRAEVQGLTWFAIRGSIVDVSCGGLSWAWHR